MARKVTTTAAQPASMAPKSAEELFKDSLWLRKPGETRAQREAFLEQPTVLAIRSATPEVQREFYGRTLERIGALSERLGYMPTFLSHHEDFPEAAAIILSAIIAKLPLSDRDFACGLTQLASLKRIVYWHHVYLIPLLDRLEAHVKEHGATPELKAAMERFLIPLSAKDERARNDKPDARQMAVVSKCKALIKTAKPAKASSVAPNGSPPVFSDPWRPSFFKPLTQTCKAGAAHRLPSLRGTPGALDRAKKLFERLNRLSRGDLFVNGWAGKKEIQELVRSEPAVQVEFLYIVFDAIAAMRKRLGPTVRSLENVADSDKRTRNAHEKYVRIDDQPGYPAAGAIAAKVLLLNWPPPFVEADYVYFLNRVAEVDFVVERSHVYLLDLVYRVQQHVQAHGLTPELNEATGRLLAVMQQPQCEGDDRQVLDQLARLHVGPVPVAPEMQLTWQVSSPDGKPEDAASRHWKRLVFVKKESCLPIEQFGKHELVQKLLADKPAVQIAFVRMMIGSELHRCRLVGATTAKPIRILKESDRSSERKMEVYRHFRNLWDDDFYSLANAIALDHVLRRDLPLTHDDLVYLTNKLADIQMVVLSCNTYVPGLVRHLKAHVDKNGTTLELSTAVKRLASAMDVPDQPEDHQKVYREVKALAAVKLAKPKAAAGKGASKSKAAAGSAPTGDAQAQAAEYFDKLPKLKVDYDELMQHKEVLAMLRANPAVHVGMVRLLAERLGGYRKTLKFPKKGGDPWADGMWAYADLEGAKDYPSRAAAVVKKILSRKLPFTAGDLATIIGNLADLEIVRAERHHFLPGLLKQVQKHIDEHGVAPELAKELRRLAAAIDMPPFTVQGNTGAALQRRTAAELREMAALGD